MQLLTVLFGPNMLYVAVALHAACLPRFALQQPVRAETVNT